MLDVVVEAHRVTMFKFDPSATLKTMAAILAERRGERRDIEL